MQQVLTLDQIQRLAPSVFSSGKSDKTSDRYRFFPTSEIVREMMNSGFQCVKAGQARTRIPGKEEFTRHVLRFRNLDVAPHVGDSIPELVLMNAHDGTSAYKLMLGMFRLVCSNGLVVKDASIGELSVRHSGDASIVQEVIDASYEVIHEAPKAIEQVRGWQNNIINLDEQAAFAKAALELRGSTITIDPFDAIRSRRGADRGDDKGNRDLWRTFNVVQENLIRGGLYGKSAPTEKKPTGSYRRLRSVKSVNEDSKLNRALWTLAAEMQAIKTGQKIAA